MRKSEVKWWAGKSWEERCVRYDAMLNGGAFSKEPEKRIRDLEFAVKFAWNVQRELWDELDLVLSGEKPRWYMQPKPGY